MHSIRPVQFASVENMCNSRMVRRSIGTSQLCLWKIAFVIWPFSHLTTTECTYSYRRCEPISRNSRNSIGYIQRCYLLLLFHTLGLRPYHHCRQPRHIHVLCDKIHHENMRSLSAPLPVCNHDRHPRACVDLPNKSKFIQQSYRFIHSPFSNHLDTIGILRFAYNDSGKRCVPVTERGFDHKTDGVVLKRVDCWHYQQSGCNPRQNYANQPEQTFEKVNLLVDQKTNAVQRRIFHIFFDDFIAATHRECTPDAGLRLNVEWKRESSQHTITDSVLDKRIIWYYPDWLQCRVLVVCPIRMAVEGLSLKCICSSSHSRIDLLFSYAEAAIISLECNPMEQLKFFVMMISIVCYCLNVAFCVSTIVVCHNNQNDKCVLCTRYCGLFTFGAYLCLVMFRIVNISIGYRVCQRYGTNERTSSATCYVSFRERIENVAQTAWTISIVSMRMRHTIFDYLDSAQRGTLSWTHTHSRTNAQRIDRRIKGNTEIDLNLQYSR